MSFGVAIVAGAARTPLGLALAGSAAAVRARISRIAEHPFMVDAQGEPVRGAIDALLPPQLQGGERLLALAAAALDDLLQGLPQELTGRSALPVLLAVPQHRPGFSADDEARLLAQLAQRYASGAARPLALRVPERGHAGALYGIGLACEWISAGKMDLCLVGGVDSYFQADTIDWLIEEDQLAMANRRTGFHPGEGAGFVLLAGERWLQSQPALRAAALVRGHQSALETALIKTDAVNQAKAMTQAIQGAARGLRDGEAVDQTWCDLNGERYRTDEWSYVLLRSPQVFRQRHGQPTRYTTTADLWGDAGAASGALMAGLALRSWARGYAEGPFSLAFGGSEGGLRSAVVLERPGAP
jgi:3-oxoacyl-[acyl-carrier-protein] synthase-1